MVSESVGEAKRRNERDVGVDLLDGLLELEVGVLRRETKLENEAVDLIDDEAVGKSEHNQLLILLSSLLRSLQTYTMGLPLATRC
jgi:hypothetical protein